MADEIRSVADMVVVVDSNTEKLQRNFADAVRAVDDFARKGQQSLTLFDQVSGNMQFANKIKSEVTKAQGLIRAIGATVNEALEAFDKLANSQGAGAQLDSLSAAVNDLVPAIGTGLAAAFSSMAGSADQAAAGLYDAAAGAESLGMRSERTLNNTGGLAEALSRLSTLAREAGNNMVSLADRSVRSFEQARREEAELRTAIESEKKLLDELGRQRADLRATGFEDYAFFRVAESIEAAEKRLAQFEVQLKRVQDARAFFDRPLPGIEGPAPDFAEAFRDSAWLDGLNQKIRILTHELAKVGESAEDVAAYTARAEMMDELERRHIELTPALSAAIDERVEKIRSLAAAKDAEAKADAERRKAEERERQLAEQSAKATETLEREVAQLERRNAAIGDNSEATRIALEVERTLDARRLAGLSIGEKEIELARRKAELTVQGAAAEARVSERASFFNSTASEISRTITGAAGTAFRDFVNGVEVDSERLSEILKKLAQDLQNLIIQRLVLDQMAKLITSGLSGGLNTLFAGGGAGGWEATVTPAGGGLDGFFAGLGGRAKGGPVSAGVPYWVGERGREIFVPDVPGSVVPNDRAMGAGGGAGGANVQVNVINNADGTKVDHRSGERGGVRFEEIIISTVAKGLATGDLDGPMAGRFGVGRQSNVR